MRTRANLESSDESGNAVHYDHDMPVAMLRMKVPYLETHLVEAFDDDFHGSGLRCVL